MADSGCEDTVPSMVTACKLPEESDASMRARLFTSLSQSFPHSMLYKALHGGEDLILNGGDNSEDDDDSLYGDHLSNSCFASLRMDRRDSDDFDDDLRSLEWLQSEDLLKNIGGEKLDREDDDGEEQKENEDIKPDINLLQTATGQQPSNIPYLPQKHVNSKPPYSFSCLIFMAVENSAKKMLPVKDIYNWILTQFPYFQNAPTGWKNSVRHNLSLNKCFKKVEKDKGQSIGKGSLWCIDPAYRPNLLQALRKTPYHPYHQLQMTSAQPQNYLQYQSLPGGGRTILPLTQRPVPNTVSPHLFPFLSRRLAQTSFDVDNEMKDVAQTLVALKGSYKKESSDASSGEDIGPTWKNHKKSYSYNNRHRRPPSPIVVTNHPYNDHAYSSTRLLDDDIPSPSSSSSIDEEYDFGDADEEGESDYQSEVDWDSDNKDEVDGDFPSNKKLKIDMGTEKKDARKSASKGGRQEESEDDEQKKIHEGANALLNLAGLLLGNRGTTSTNTIGGSDKSSRDSAIKRYPTNRGKKVKKKNQAHPRKKKEVVKIEENVKEKKGFSKRKNAGSNGKYDKSEYSLLKLKKNTNVKSRTSSVKLSSGHKDVKSSKLALNSKTLSRSKADKEVRKTGGAEKRKLKLSKNFGTNKKTSTLSSKVGLVVDVKTPKKSVSESGAKRRAPVIKSSKKTKLAVKKAKDNNVGILTAEPSSTTTAVVNTSDLISTSNVNSVNNNNIAKETNYMSDDLEKRTSSEKDEQLAKEHKLSSKESVEAGDALKLDQSTKAVDTMVSEVVTPAGDAPLKSVLRSTPEADIPPYSYTSQNTTVSSSEIGNNDGRFTTTNNGSSISDSPSPFVATTGTSHKSPHFTRFSKKKAALS